MKARHISYEETYRTPFGAAVLNTPITLAIDTWEGMARACDLRLWQEGVGETIVPMKSASACPPIASANAKDAKNGSNEHSPLACMDDESEKCSSNGKSKALTPGVNALAPDNGDDALALDGEFSASDGNALAPDNGDDALALDGGIPASDSNTLAPDGSNAPCRRFTATISPDTLGVLWYSFRIVACDGRIVWLGAPEGWVTGEGVLYDHEPPSFQITVFQPRESAFPSWYANGVVYQIFPDRFSRGADWPKRAQAALDAPRRGPARCLIDNWNTPPTYDRAANGDIASWDFYGGSFAGIRERLDYLQDLGVSVLYLNPIFEAASSHRYDTADYLACDPMLGTIDDFRALCDDARAHGMSIILDGVFNHSGQDSRYFNAYGNYPDLGAAQSENSPYRSWYHFNDNGTYESWWGVKDLPEYDEDDPSLREFFCGENGVVRTWLRAGAAGWRLDVADELPDSFIEDIKAAAIAEKPDALVIGEVWEDASNKYAYGQLRHYFQGSELDGAMNYPFRTTTIDYLTGAIHAPEAAALLRQLAENYPPESLACCLNLLGSHDRERILTMLGDAPRNDDLPENERATYRLSPQQRELAINRSRLAVLLQMCAPGVPSIYYGDETGLEGYRDPYNRATMPWDDFDREIFDFYRAAVALRRSLPLLVNGSFEPVSFGNEVLGWWRREKDCATTHNARNTESVLVLVNRSPWDWATVSVPAEGECVSELARAQAARIENGHVTIHLKPFESSVLYFHPAPRLQKPLVAGKGLIAHLTSVPNATGPGTLGAPAHAFVDWLTEHDYTYWQMLPVNPTDEYGSPYAGLSAFAGNPALIDRSDIDATGAPLPPDNIVDNNTDANPNDPGSNDRNTAGGSINTNPSSDDNTADNAYWLAPYAAFRAIKKLLDEKPWQEWPKPYHTWNLDLVDAAKHPELADEIARVCQEQHLFQKQWDDARTYANAHGVKIIGDLPMYVSADSADVWAHPDLFDLDEQGYPAGIAGVPPDNLCADGQIWGNPTYRWDRMAKDGYNWWMRRLARMFELYDYVRLDHFLGFSSYYVIRAGQKATEGTWKHGPGKAFFDLACKYFDDSLPLIGENLGTITPAVRALVATCGFPGMDVIQFADNDPRDYYDPAPDTIIFLGTHDTQTLVGWCESRYGLTREQAREQAQHFIDRTLAEQPDCTIMMQLQDALLLGDEARMNTPGTAEGNWTWQMQ